MKKVSLWGHSLINICAHLRNLRSIPVVVQRPGTDNTFPLEFGLLEIEQQRKMQTGDGEVTDHLGDVGFVEGRDHLRVNNDRLIHDQVGNKLADLLLLIENPELLLLLDAMAALPQLDDQGVLVDFSSNPGFRELRTFIAAPIMSWLSSLWGYSSMNINMYLFYRRLRR